MYQRSCQAGEQKLQPSTIYASALVKEVAKVVFSQKHHLQSDSGVMKGTLNKFLRSTKTTLGGYGIEFCISLILKI